jgi:DNA-binding NarL/FixJ family response regulator
VVLSSSRDPDDIKKAYLLGAASYHLKPGSLGGLRQLLRVIHDYWMTCEVPEVDLNGHQVPTNAAGKLGERFTPPAQLARAG